MAASLTWGLQAEGYVVDTASDGPEGFWKARESAHDVIVLDVMLPGLDGYQVCKKLREEGIWTPILMLTAMNDHLDEAEGLDSGADDYLTKPFAYPVLLARIRALSRRELGERPVLLTAAGLSLDPSSHTVSGRHGTLDLTRREFAVLEHLLRRQGHVVSKTELLDHCWDTAYDGDTAVVEVQVHRLRRKIVAHHGHDVILTLRGQGYLIESDAE